MIYITFGFKTIQVKWITLYSVNLNAHTTPVRIYGESYAHKFCAVDIFRNITRRQVISHVAKFHHVLGVVSWYNGWYWFLSNVSQPITINYFTWKYNINVYVYVDRIQSRPAYEYLNNRTTCIDISEYWTGRYQQQTTDSGTNYHVPVVRSQITVVHHLLYKWLKECTMYIRNICIGFCFTTKQKQIELQEILIDNHLYSC